MSQAQALHSQDQPVPDIHADGPPLTLAEVARELRCSKGHVHNIIHGKVEGLPPLPVLRIGRRIVIRVAALKDWMLSLEAREIEAQKLTGNFR